MAHQSLHLEYVLKKEPVSSSSSAASAAAAAVVPVAVEAGHDAPQAPHDFAHLAVIAFPNSGWSQA